MVVRNKTPRIGPVVLRLLVLVIIGVVSLSCLGYGSHLLNPETNAFLYLFIGAFSWRLFDAQEDKWRTGGKLDV